MPKPSPHPTFYNYHRPSWLFICVVILWCGALGQLGRQFLDNLYSRHRNGYPPRIAGFVKCISGQCPGNVQNTCPAPEYLPGSHGQGDKTPQYPAKPCPGWQYTGKDKIQTEGDGKQDQVCTFAIFAGLLYTCPAMLIANLSNKKLKPKKSNFKPSSSDVMDAKIAFKSAPGSKHKLLIFKVANTHALACISFMHVLYLATCKS